MQQQEGFDSTCGPLTDETSCTNTAGCNWDTSSNTCMACSDYTDCASCSSVNTCGWCSDVKKCVASDRNGNAYGAVCKPAQYIVSASQCANTVQQLPASAPLTPSDMEKEVFNTNLPVQTYTQENADSCSTEKIVANVKNVLDANVKSIIRAELTSNNVPVVEGFTQDDNLAMNVIASIDDDVRSITRKSICANVTDALVCNGKPACKWDISEKQCISK